MILVCEKVSVSILLAVIPLCLQIVVAETKCPPGFYTSANATAPCSKCWSFAYCSSHTQAAIELDLILTRPSNSNNSLMIGNMQFALDRSKDILQSHFPYRKLPQNMNISKLDQFYCSHSKRHGYFCSNCNGGCGIATYTYYGLPCACKCYNYGIILYIILEVVFSTLFFGLIIVFKVSVYSSNVITLILYFQLIAHIFDTEPLIYTTTVVNLGYVLPITIITVYGIWNMDFFRHVVPAFCVSRHQSILSAISSGYISAVWPLFLIIMISLSMELHKRNFKAVVHTWKLIDRVSSGAIQRRFAETNLIHTFASFFLLSYYKTIYVSSAILGASRPSYLNTENGTLSPSTWHSFDPQIHYFSHDHLVYAVPAILIILVIGVLIPLVMIIYPTRVGTWVGNRWRTGRIRIAGKTFIEAFQGCYKDGTNGDRDYRVIPGLYLIVRFFIGTLYIQQANTDLHDNRGVRITVIVASLVTAAFYGLAKPYKRKLHNLYDVLLYSLLAVQNVILYAVTSFPKYKFFLVGLLSGLSLLPLAIAVPALLISFILQKKR